LKPQSEWQGKSPSGIWSITNDRDRWLRQVQATESRYFRAIGSAEALMPKAAERWAALDERAFWRISDADLSSSNRIAQLKPRTCPDSWPTGELACVFGGSKPFTRPFKTQQGSEIIESNGVSWPFCS